MSAMRRASGWVMPIMVIAFILYALFGEYGADVYAVIERGTPNDFTLDKKSEKKLETFWPLAVGKETTYQLRDTDTYLSPAQMWTIKLKVAGTETVESSGRRYQAYIVEERGESDGGMSFKGRKWYHPVTGLVVRSWRSGTGVNATSTFVTKIANLGKDEEAVASLRQVEFPPGTAPAVVAGDLSARMYVCF